MKRKKIIITYFLTAIVVIASIFLITLSYAKYTGNEEEDNLVLVYNNNYFESDLLKDNAYSLNNTYDVYGDFKVNLYNYDQNNKYTISENNIAYGYTIKYYTEEDVEINALSASLNNQIFSASSLNKKEISIVYNDEASYVKIEATSSSPYIKKIVGKFVFKNDALNYYSFVDEGLHCVLTIETGNNPGSIDVNYGMLKPDNTNEFMNDWISGNTNTLLGLLPKSKYEFVFFDTTGSVHSSVSKTLISSVITIS